MEMFFWRKKNAQAGAWVGERLFKERNCPFAAFGVVIRFKAVLGTRSFNVTVEVE